MNTYIDGGVSTLAVTVSAICSFFVSRMNFLHFRSRNMVSSLEIVLPVLVYFIMMSLGFRREYTAAAVMAAFLIQNFYLYYYNLPALSLYTKIIFYVLTGIAVYILHRQGDFRFAYISAKPSVVFQWSHLAAFAGALTAFVSLTFLCSDFFSIRIKRNSVFFFTVIIVTVAGLSLTGMFFLTFFLSFNYILNKSGIIYGIAMGFFLPLALMLFLNILYGKTSFFTAVFLSLAISLLYEYFIQRTRTVLYADNKRSVIFNR